MFKIKLSTDYSDTFNEILKALNPTTHKLNLFGIKWNVESFKAQAPFDISCSIFTNELFTTGSKLFKLTSNCPDDDWYCISCEKKVTSFTGEHLYENIIIPSYFISLYPNNARICKDCLAKIILKGSN